MAKSTKTNESWLLERQRSMVMKAAEKGMGNLVLFALDENPAVDARQLAEGSDPQNVPLVTACLNGHLDVAKNLIDKCHGSLDCRADVTVEKQLFTGVTPLWAAACSGSLELVKYLVQKGANVNQGISTQSTPLRPACFDGYTAVVQFLVDNGADVNSMHSNGTSVLMVACFQGHEDIVTILLDHGADVNFIVPPLEKIDAVGRTALHCCGEAGNVKIAKMLIERGATITRDFQGFSPLLRAAYEGHEDFVNYSVELPDASRDDKADALELMGANRWKKENINQCLALWQLAMEERHRPGRPVVWKKEADRRIAAYDNAEEIQTLAEFQKLKSSRDHHQIGVQCMLIAERVLGKENKSTSDFIKYNAAVYMDEKQFKKAAELLFHNVENLSDVFPFEYRTVDVYALLMIVFVQDDEDSDKATFTQYLKALKSAMSDFKRGEKDKLHHKTETYLSHRQHLLQIILHFICLLHQSLDQATPEEDRQLSEEIKAFVRMKFCGQNGETLLHMACDAESANFTEKNPFSLSDAYPTLDFPDLAVVKALLAAGCDVAAKNEGGQTALQVARKQKGDYSELIGILMSAESG